MPKLKSRRISAAQWNAEGEARFGPDRMAWYFTCPMCGNRANARDYHAVNAPEGAVGFSCVGRWVKNRPVRKAFGGSGPGPCDYAGGGLFCVNPVIVEKPDGETVTFFEFADWEK